VVDKCSSLTFIHTSTCCLVWVLVCSVTHAEVVLDGSLGSEGVLQGPDYNINQTHGRTAGNNLFHSFETFNVNTGESATFYSAPAIENIISRVTGDQASWIDGPLRGRLSGTDTLSSANLYSLNPNGIIFGPNASLDIGGSFHASTAEELEFDNGEIFNAHATAGAPIFSAAKPEAFGFLGETSIELRGTVLESSHDIALSAGTVALNEGAIIVTFTDGPEVGGHISLTATDRVRLSEVNKDGISSAGLITITSGDGDAGALHMTAPVIELQDGATMVSHTSGSGKGGELVVSASERLTLSGADKLGRGSSLQTTILADGDAGTLHVTAPVIELQDGATMVSHTLFGSGKGGELVVTASERLTLSGADKSGRGSRLGTMTLVDGDAGALHVAARVIELQDGATMESVTLGSGKGGELVVTASERLALSGADKLGNDSSLHTITFGDGDAGALHMQAPVIELQNGASIAANTQGTGHGGAVSIKAGKRLALTGAGVNGTGSFLQAAAFAEGDAGDVRVEAPLINLVDGAYMLNNTHGAGTGGEIIIIASEHLALSGNDSGGVGSSLEAATLKEENGRAIRLEKWIPFTLGGQSLATAVSIDPGIRSDSIGPTPLNTDSGTGNAGAIHVEAPLISLENGAYMLTNTESVGGGGEIVINASKHLALSGVDGQGRGSSLQAITTAEGNAGIIHATAPIISLTDGANMLTNTEGLGIGGELIINAAERLTLSGSDASGSGSTIQAITVSNGIGGPILVDASVISFTDGASINSSSRGTGDAGSITVIADDSLHLTDNSNISTASEAASGGNISIQAGRQIYLKDSSITASVINGQGRGGNITIGTSIIPEQVILVPEQVVLNRSRITASADAGQGGAIDIVADHVITSADSVIDASAGPAGIDGNVRVAALQTDVGGNLTVLPTAFIDVTKRLNKSCAKYVRGQASSFVVNGTSGTGSDPDHFLPAHALNTIPQFQHVAGYDNKHMTHVNNAMPQAPLLVAMNTGDMHQQALDWVCN